MDGMTEAEGKRCKKIMKRLRMTAPGETICLTYADVVIVLKFCDILVEDVVGGIVRNLPKINYKRQKGDKGQ